VVRVSAKQKNGLEFIPWVIAPVVDQDFKAIQNRNDPMEDNYFKWAVAAGVLAAAIIGGIFYFNRPTPQPATAVQASAPAEASSAAATGEHFEVPDEEKEVETGAPKPTPLPNLEDSDAAFGEQLQKLFGGDTLNAYLVPSSVIRHLVVTLDNLPRATLPPLDYQPTKPVDGNLQVTQDGDHVYLAPGNEARYRPLVALFDSVDPHRLVALYFHFYPLFQQAYVDIGYPQGYFNDRLVQVIDNLLATPELDGPIELVRPKVLYQFADPKLESLSTGQKMLIRMGAANRAELKTRLRTLRALIAAHPRPKS
jgi:hypothetical protein